MFVVVPTTLAYSLTKVDIGDWQLRQPSRLESSQSVDVSPQYLAPHLGQPTIAPVIGFLHCQQIAVWAGFEAGGGDTLSAINKAKAKDAFNYLSNAGGAFLEWLEGNKSPGFIALKENRL